MTANTNDPPVIGPDHQLPPPGGRSTSGLIWKIIISIVVLAVFVLAFVWVLHQHEAAQQTSSRRAGAGGSVTITVATAKKGSINQYIKGIGNVTAIHTVAVTSQVTGPISEVHFVEGQMVHKGDPLIEIEPAPFQATLLQSQGALERDQNLLAQAQMDLERYQKAWAKNAIAKQILDDQEKLVLQQQGTVKNDQGTVNFNQIQVNYCHITSPIDGRVGLRLVDPYNVINASGVQSSGSPALAVVTQIDPITVVFTIPEDSIELIRTHESEETKMAVDAFDRDDQKLLASGTMLTLDNQIDTTTGTVKVRAIFPNKDGVLFPNQFVNARLLVTTYNDVTIVPASVIQQNGQVSFVYVIKDGEAEMRNITPGVTDGTNTQVQGLEPGEVVAYSGFERLQDKTKVSISKTPPTTGQSPTTRSSSSTRPTTRKSHMKDAGE